MNFGVASGASRADGLSSGWLGTSVHEGGWALAGLLWTGESVGVGGVCLG